MAVYKFKVSFEELEDVYREIEIKSSQTFQQLHDAIQKSIGFDGKEMASFYLTNDTWRPGKEITLMDMGNDDEEEEERSLKLVMSKTKLADCIEDPHQKLIYVFDFINMWSFYVELIKIMPDNAKVKYPLCSKSIGVAPKQHKSKKALQPNDEDEDEPKSKKQSVFNDEIEYGLSSAEDEDDLNDGFGEETEDGLMEGYNEFE